MPVTVVRLDTHAIFLEMHKTLLINEEAYIRNEQISLLLHRLLIQVAAPKQYELFKGKLPIERLKDYLDEHPFDKITLDMLVDQFFISKSQLIRLFKESYGMTPYAYVQMNRINIAKSLLMHTNMQIKAIAKKLCFSDEHYFSKEFKKAEQITPKAFRSRYQNEK